MTSPSRSEFLRRTEIIDWDHPAVMQRARSLAADKGTLEIAKACFEWVRDEVQHSRDFEKNPVTWRASDVLLHGTGYCYAKSHLLAALLRANGIAAGFCYQRLSIDDAGPPYSLHGLNAIELPEFGWYRVDPRGNRAGIDAQFSPPVERLAFKVQASDEADFLTILPDPLECVVGALQSCTTWQEALTSLPDVAPNDFERLGLRVR